MLDRAPPCRMRNFNPNPLYFNFAMKLISFVIAFYQLFLVTGAAPLERKDDDCTQTHSSKATWDTVDKYTVELFQAEATLRPEPNLCLFYTRGLSETARRYAKTRPNGESPMTTIWVFACSLHSPRILLIKPRMSGPNNTTTAKPREPIHCAAS